MMAHPELMMTSFNLDEKISRDNASSNFLKLFYPYHYTVGMAVEKHLCGDHLDRHQTVILWLIHSKGENGNSLPRKIVESLIGEWYEVGSSYISKTLRKMAAPPLNLIEIRENPDSAREKLVVLTAEGQRTVAEMKCRATEFIDRIVEHLSAEDIVQGMHFMELVSTVTDHQIGSD